MNVKEPNYEDTRAKICQLIASEYARCAFLLEGDCLTEQEKDTFRRMSIDMDDVNATYERYDIMLEPKKEDLNAYIIEFKVYNPRRDGDLEDTVKAALVRFCF